MLELQNVSFSFEGTQLLQTLSHSYAEGKTTAITGPPGCGKSVLLKLSAGLLLPSQGRVLFRGQDIAQMRPSQNMAFRKASAVIFQNSALWANQSIYQNLELPLKQHYPDQSPTERNYRIQEVLEEVGYQRPLNIRPAALSMGEQKLVAFARALLCSPRLLFLDEWTESLNDKAARKLLSIVEGMKAKNSTIIFVSHDQSIVASLADHTLFLECGTLCKKG
ncbi:ATP-binding cassette domain-containing protein [Desulfovibrio sp. OttesenSCG-928-M14]|nr:ATP-binding cassette domain-containing protein [Desulfovibrio sp. OttesenSCG-928-M16]MDL2216331.1 ATP-binding cassette domain-containing protein [Desulfovibrio sp. OttesenSCG-928-M14]